MSRMHAVPMPGIKRHNDHEYIFISCDVLLAKNIFVCVESIENRTELTAMSGMSLCIHAKYIKCLSSKWNAALCNVVRPLRVVFR